MGFNSAFKGLNGKLTVHQGPSGQSKRGDK